jgi:hypothetical protein
MRKLLKKYGFLPETLVTDDLLPRRRARSWDRASASYQPRAKQMGRIRIKRPDDENARCKVSRAPDQRKDFSQSTPRSTTHSTSNATLSQLEHEPSGPRRTPMPPMTRAGPAPRVGLTPTELERVTFRNKRYGLEQGKSAAVTAALLACFEPKGMRAIRAPPSALRRGTPRHWVLPLLPFRRAVLPRARPPRGANALFRSADPRAPTRYNSLRDLGVTIGCHRTSPPVQKPFSGTGSSVMASDIAAACGARSW